MIRKYDLAQMMREIKEDETVVKEKLSRWASQADIREMVSAMKVKRQVENQG